MQQGATCVEDATARAEEIAGEACDDLRMFYKRQIRALEALKDHRIEEALSYRGQ